MKRKIIGLFLCISLAAAFAGCGDIPYIKSSDSTTAPTSISEETTKGEEKSSAETSDETSAQEQATEAATDATTTAPKKEFENGVYNNGQVTLTLPDGWTYDESMGTPMFLSPAEPVNGIQTNFNVMIEKEADGLMDTTEEEYRESMEAMFGTGVNIKTFEKKELAGRNVIYAEYSITFNEITQFITQIIYNENGNNVTYTYISGSPEQPSECIEIFNSLKLL